MNHLLICREYPPAAYPPGGIGTYVKHMAGLLAEAGERVHVIAQRWEGAPNHITESYRGNLIVHRVALADPVPSATGAEEQRRLKGLALSDCPSQAFAWQAMRLAESLIEAGEIDVIEAQEWEAPLYYLQVRRALGLGPKNQPPCLVHLHSPSELIFQHNQWNRNLADFLPLTRFEQYTVRAADALICPSRYLARGAAELFALGADEIQVIPYPMGDTPVIARTPQTWEKDSICFVGRLELRKGIIEWVEAAVQVAQSHPSVNFEFVGSDTSFHGGAGSVLKHLEGMIPRTMRPRFRFHGSRSHKELFRILERVPVVVVPSLWENLPYTCIEAMATGLPILASPNGGMAELITDGKSGWIATGATPGGFAAALRRVLATPAEQRAAMGEEASAAVRRICGNQSIVQQQLELRKQIVETRAHRSRRIPSNSLVRGHRAEEKKRNITSAAPAGSGIGLVVACLGDGEILADCLHNIRQQTTRAGSVVVVAEERKRRVLEQRGYAQAGDASGAGFSMLFVPDLTPEAAWRLGGQALLNTASPLLGAGFLTEDALLEPHCLSAVESVLKDHPTLGVLSSWRQHDSGFEANPTPVLASENLDSGILRYSFIRAEALKAALTRRGAGDTLADDVSAACAGKWAYLTYPDTLLSIRKTAKAECAAPEKRFSVLARAQRDSVNGLKEFLAAPLTEKLDWIRRGLKQPRRTVQWVAWQARGFTSKALDSR